MGSKTTPQAGKQHFLSLSASERALLGASAQILSAFIASGRYSESEAKQLCETSFNLAVSLAEQIEAEVSADDELPG
ncbi:MAG: hypothetical protein FJ386_03065 [Verrucomicrobia bacterium]|nr:hypothetical protein [Verrucomicrobiota bacterium]